MRRPILSLGAALLMAAGALVPPSGAAGVVLLYSFRDWQVLTYRVSNDQAQTRRMGATVSATHAVLTYLAHYQFSTVTAQGGTKLTLVVDHRDVRITRSGQTVRLRPSTSATQFLQDADGRQYGLDRAYHGAYGNGDVGVLPAQPVAVGSSWTSELTDRAPILQRTPQRVATIRTTCSIAGHGDIDDQQGAHYHVAASDVITGTWRFAVDGGRFLAQTTHEAVVETGTVRDAQGTRPFSENDTSTITQRFVAASTVK